MKKRILATLLALSLVLGLIPPYAHAQDTGDTRADTTIAAGEDHSGVIGSDNSLWVWGSNTLGQLGTGTKDTALSPVKIMDNVKSVSTGRRHMAAIQTDNSLWLWGCNHSGELGNGISGNDSGFIWDPSGGDDYPIQTVPVKVMEDVSAVSCGNEFTAAIKADGSLWMWGMNEYGQLGIGTTDMVTQPVKVMDNVVAVSVGRVHTIAVKSDGSVWTWGGPNNEGELGNGTTSGSSLPKQIPGLIAKVPGGTEPDPKPDPDPIPPLPGDGSIISLSPVNGATDVGYDASNPPVFKIKFDREIASAYDQEFVADVDLTMDGAFSIYRASDDKLIYRPSEYARFDFALDTTKTVLTVTPVMLLEPNTQYYITMGEGFVRFAGGTGSPAIAKNDWTFKTRIFEKDGTFAFLGSNGSDTKYTYSYSDSYFYEAGNKYNHDLANMSLNLAMSAFNSSEAPDSNYNEDKAAKNVKDLLTDLRFGEIETSSYEGMPYTNSIAAAYAQKNLDTDYGNYTLIAVAIRGAGYEAEWGGDFVVGQNGNHRGFQLAADRVLSMLKQYISSNDISGNVKIWITGYSRAAATANLTAATIDKGGLFTGDDAVDSSTVMLSTADVYAYTFETPMGTTDQTSDFRLNNIHNIVNPIDLVPKVAPKDWGFTRYGITYYMPSGETNAVGYSDRIMRVIKEYSKIVNGKDSGNLLAIRQLSNQSAVLDNFLRFLAYEMPRTDYSPQYEHLIVPVISEIMGADGMQYGDNIFWAIEEFCLRHPKDSAKIINSLKRAVGNKIVWYIAAEQGFEHLYKALGWEGATATDTIKLIGDTIFQSHYPEVTMAWMRTINGADGYGSGKYRKLYVNCPVDVSVYDSNNLLVAQIIDDDPQLIEDSLIGAYIDNDGQKIVVLPTDMEYRVVVDATNDGTMTYTVEEYDINTSNTDRLVSYQDIGIKNGDSLSGLIENLEETSRASYPLYKGDELTSLIPDVDNTANNNQPGNPVDPEVPIRPTNPNNGNSGNSSDNAPFYAVSLPAHITGGTVKANPTSAQKGTLITLTATPAPGYELVFLIVTDSRGNELELMDKGGDKYTFTMPASKVTVDAVFRPIPVPEGSQVPWVNPFTDIAEGTWYYDAVKYVSEKGFMTGTGSSLFSPDATTTRAMIWTILARLNGVDTSGGNPWYKKGQDWATANQISDGTAPDASITREQLITMLWRYKGNPNNNADLSRFADSGAVSEWAKDAIEWAVSTYLLQGSGGKLDLTGTATRAQVATILQRYCETLA